MANPEPRPRPAHVGGSFAPPLTDAAVADYGSRIAALPAGPIKDALTICLTCCQVWWDLPEPVGTNVRVHPSGVGAVVALQDDHREALDPHIPWGHELDAIQALFDGIDPERDRELRNMAFHLLWHVRELDNGREPVTTDRL